MNSIMSVNTHTYTWRTHTHTGTVLQQQPQLITQSPINTTLPLGQSTTFIPSGQIGLTNQMPSNILTTPIPTARMNPAVSARLSPAFGVSPFNPVSPVQPLTPVTPGLVPQASPYRQIATPSTVPGKQWTFLLHFKDNATNVCSAVVIKSWKDWIQNSYSRARGGASASRDLHEYTL